MEKNYDNANHWDTARSSKRNARALSNGRGSTTVADWRCDGYEYYTIPAASSDPEDTFLRRRRRCPCVSVFPVCRQVSAPYAHPPRAPGDTRRRSHGSHPSLVAGWLCRIRGLYVIIIIPTISFFTIITIIIFTIAQPPPPTPPKQRRTYIFIHWYSDGQAPKIIIVLRNPCAVFEQSPK